MEQEMTTRQVVDAIHEGLPTAPLTEEQMAAPDKKSAGNHFAKYIDGLKSMEHHSSFPITAERYYLF